MEENQVLLKDGKKLHETNALMPYLSLDGNLLGYISRVIYMLIKKLFTLTRLMMSKHSEQFFKDTCI